MEPRPFPDRFTITSRQSATAILQTIDPSKKKVVCEEELGDHLKLS